jgi:putative ABC transport system substrate-binding protein
LAADLVRRQVTVIAANGPAAVAAKVATTTVPIVFFSAGDPVERGLVASLNRPGGNLTGVSTLGVEVMAKPLQLLHELVPTATIMTLLVNPTNPTIAEAESRAVQAAATAFRLQLHVLHASTERDFNTVFATLVQLRTARRAGAPAWGACDLPVSRIYRSRRPDELWQQRRGRVLSNGGLHR